MLLLFIAVGLLIAFGPGYQTLAFAPVLCLVLCRYIWTNKYSNWTPAIMWLCSAIGTFGAYAGCFESTKRPDIWHSKNTRKFIPLAFEISLVFTVGFLFYRAVLQQISKYHKSVDYLFGFPMIWTFVWSVYYRISNYGDFGNWHMALSLMEIEPLTRGAAWLFGSMSGGCYLSALISMLVHDSLLSTGGKYEKKICLPTNKARKSATPISRTAIFVVGLLFVIGSNNWYPGSFYQTPIDSFAPKKNVHASCIIRGNLISTQSALDNLTPIPPNDIRLVFWSETSVTTKNESSLIMGAQKLAVEYNAVIGLSYLEIIEKDMSSPFRYKNKFALILPRNDTGKIEFIYQKNHPVPGVEKEVEPGQDSIIKHVTVHGVTIAVAICFDMNFPTLDKQLWAVNNVDILLQPSATWGSIGKFHTLENRLRAVDHQFTLVRCASKGFSGVYDRMHSIISEQITVDRGTIVNMKIPIWGRNIKSVYQLSGDWLFAVSSLAVVFWSIGSFLACFRK